MTLRPPDEASSTRFPFPPEVPIDVAGCLSVVRYRTNASSTGPLQRPREVKIVRRKPDAAEILLGAPRDMVRAVDIAYGETFSSLTQRCPQIDKIPCRTLLVCTAAIANERPLFAFEPSKPTCGPKWH